MILLVSILFFSSLYIITLFTGQSQAILITGIIGSGKSLLVRTEIQSVIRKCDNSFLGNLDKIIFISTGVLCFIGMFLSFFEDEKKEYEK